MTEETEVAEVETPVAEQPEVKQEVKAPEPPRQDHNWSEAREVLRLQKQRIEELEARVSQQSPPPQQEVDEFDQLDPDDYMTVAKAKSIRDAAKKHAAKEAVTAAKQVLNEFTQQQKVEKDEERMRGKHDDYDYVMEHFAIPMIKNDPALAYKIQSSKNPAETAYKLGKLSDSYEGDNVKPSPRAEKVIRNSSRPVSSHSNISLKNQADVFSKMSPAEIWAQSQEYAKRA